MKKDLRRWIIKLDGKGADCFDAFIDYNLIATKLERHMNQAPR